MRAHGSSSSGFSLVETMIALSVLSVGMLGAAAVFTQGMQKMASSPGDLIATQKAAEAIESVYSARNSQTLTWAQIRNVKGGSGSDGGVFLDGPQGIKTPGNDGVVGTADDGAVESWVLPGPDQILGTPDDVTQTLTGYTREIQIRDIELGLRSIVVIVTFQSNTGIRTYTLTTYISNYT